MNTWKEELLATITDEWDIDDFAKFHASHPGVETGELWRFVYNVTHDACCKGCVNSKHLETGEPCISCLRPIRSLKDNYASQEV